MLMDCELCGDSLCKHGFCSNRGDVYGRNACPKSEDARGWNCQDCAETAFDQWINDFYGGDGPQTDRERQEIAYREFKGVR
jgi:hypothetical protein